MEKKEATSWQKIMKVQTRHQTIIPRTVPRTAQRTAIPRTATARTATAIRALTVPKIKHPTSLRIAEILIKHKSRHRAGRTAYNKMREQITENLCNLFLYAQLAEKKLAALQLRSRAKNFAEQNSSFYSQPRKRN